MTAIFKRTQTNLLIASMAAGLGMHLAAQAQAVNDQGTLIITGQISNTTCVLSMGDLGSTNAGVKSINLGTYTTAVANAATTNGGTFGNAISTTFSVKNADGSACSANGASKWDIGINLASSQVTTTSTGTTLLVSGGTSGIAGNVGVLLKTSFGSGVTAGTTNLNLLSTAGGAYGVLLSGGTTASAPQVNFADNLAVTAQFARTNSTAPTSGVYTATIPLNVWYK